MLTGFRQFILRGNVVDLAVGVVIGSSFGAIVTALVKDLITPLIAAIGGQPDFSRITFTIHSSKFLIGDFINTLVSFLIIAAVIYFFVVTPINKLMNRVNSNKKSDDPTTKKCSYCLSVVPVAATKCAFCTSTLKK